MTLRQWWKKWFGQALPSETATFSEPAAVIQGKQTQIIAPPADDEGRIEPTSEPAVHFEVPQAGESPRK